MAERDAYQHADFPQPEGFSFAKHKIKLTEANRVEVTIPALITWSKDCQTPEVNEVDGSKKWNISLAIPKTPEGNALVAALKVQFDAMMKADGVKGAYPNAIRDGAAKDPDGMFIRSGGQLQNYWYLSAKTKREPKVLKREDGDLIALPDTSTVTAGTYCLIAGNFIPISYGDGSSKKGPSFWFNKILLCGGGRPMGGPSNSDEDDFGDMIEGAESSDFI